MAAEPPERGQHPAAVPGSGRPLLGSGVHRDLQRRLCGLGLGLAIVRHIVELHQGSVHAGSAGEGKGATFTVDLPIATPAEVAVDVGGIAKETIGLDGVRVLIVDDHADSRDLFATILSRQRAEVTTVETVREALAEARRVRPHVIVCDVAMPGDDGFALVREVRSWPSDHGIGVPAVALTAYARPEDRERTLAAGFQAHLSKPVEPRALLETVARLAAGGAREAVPARIGKGGDRQSPPASTSAVSTP